LLIVALAAGLSLLGAILTVAPPASAPTLFATSRDAGPLAEQRPETMVLTLDDVLPLSRTFDLDPERTGPWDSATAAAAWPDGDAAIKRYQQWERSLGHRSAFWRPRLSGDTQAPVAVQSSVSLYRSAQGAEDALRYEASRLAGPKAAAVSIASIGETTAAYRAANGPFTTYLVQFRKGNGVATLVVICYADASCQEVVEGLAATMADRMR
jgi:hypothetical protein